MKITDQDEVKSRCISGPKEGNEKIFVVSVRCGREGGGREREDEKSSLTAHSFSSHSPGKMSSPLITVLAILSLILAGSRGEYEGININLYTSIAQQCVFTRNLYLLI